jgi:hypothetical protein
MKAAIIVNAASSSKLLVVDASDVIQVREYPRLRVNIGTGETYARYIWSIWSIWSKWQTGQVGSEGRLNYL